ncbi:M23 family metallopeptidase [Brevibacillus ruminantium]|uniref:M23 family metallopeptidase n=1 Tax=Brevibacillus ruminantium TaxID=2950604 RepID=A0ABY4WIX5_9BACL|nr:M23 family metallopeptidase [Brevibacillus ruminantium]USG67100.1 M23 family metallopeptidase [Brevibacillus ruminantium]
MRKLKIGLAAVVLSLGMTGIVSAEELKPLGDPDNIYKNYGWTWPTSGTGSRTISSKYGVPRKGERNPYHVGIDISVKQKPVYAVADGKVVKSGEFRDGTQVIIIAHDDTAIDGTPLYTRYLHLEENSLLVRKNDTVYEGDKIATSGNTGGVPYHLHFDINEAESEYPIFNDRKEETINPAYFWPRFIDSFTLSSSNDVEENEICHEPEDFDNPDFFFDQILIDYVGEKEFDNWFDSLDVSDRTVTKLKSDFNISDDEVEKIFEIAEEKAKEKAKKKKKSQ